MSITYVEYTYRCEASEVPLTTQWCTSGAGGGGSLLETVRHSPLMQWFKIIDAVIDVSSRLQIFKNKL